MSRLAHLLRRSPKNRYNKGQTINYPSTRKVSNLTNAITNFVNNNTNVLALPNRGTIVKDAVLAANPNIVTRKGTNITTKNVDKTLNKEYGKLDRGNISIANNPNAVALIEKMVSRQPSVKSTEIIEELTKIDPIYANVSNEAITTHINRSGLIRTNKTPQEILDKRNLKTKIQSELDDPIVSAGIENLRSNMVPYFSKILDKSQMKNVLEGAHPAQLVNRVQPEGKTFITTPFRNSVQNRLENEAKRLMEQKNAIVSNLNDGNMHVLSYVNNQIKNVSDQMSRLGLESKLMNEATGQFNYFGNLYPNVSTLYKSVKGPPGGIGPSVTEKGFGFAQGGLVSLLKDKSLRRMAKNLIPKQFSILQGGLS